LVLQTATRTTFVSTSRASTAARRLAERPCRTGIRDVRRAIA
jgi:hypothetical protein